MLFSLNGLITHDVTNNFIHLISKAVHDKADIIKLNISSMGGDVTSAICLYNYLKTLPVKLITFNCAEVSSAAVIVYLAGQERYAKEYSKFIIHQPAIEYNQAMTYWKLKELYESIQLDIDNYANIFNESITTANNKIDIVEILKSNSLVLNKIQAYEIGLITSPDSCTI